jgi:hypothetical protein
MTITNKKSAPVALDLSKHTGVEPRRPGQDEKDAPPRVQLLRHRMDPHVAEWVDTHKPVHLHVFVCD